MMDKNKRNQNKGKNEKRGLGSSNMSEDEKRRIQSMGGKASHSG